MYLSKKEIVKALDLGELIVEPRPADHRIDATSVDLELDVIDQALVWDLSAFSEHRRISGDPQTELRIGSFDYRQFSWKYLIRPPLLSSCNPTNKPKVVRRDNEVIVSPGGFLLWQTKERVGTPSKKSKYMCFVDGKSTWSF